MQRYIAIRLVLAVVTVIGISIIVFLMARISGDVTALLLPPEDVSRPEDFVRLRAAYGLDKPVVEQYFVWIGNLLQGDFGESIRFRQPALDLIWLKIPNTAKLAAVTAVFTLIIGVSIGIVSALKPGGLSDRFGRGIALLGQAAPNFVVAILLILLLAVQWRLLPTSGMGSAKNYIMPAFSLGLFSIAALVRMSRSAMLDVLDRDHIKLARLNGVPETSIIVRHALKNAAIPIITLFSVQFIFFVSGSVIVETIFAWPGMGRLTIEAIRARDYPLVQAIVLMVGIGVVLMNLLVDLLYAWIDPRIRLSAGPA